MKAFSLACLLLFSASVFAQFVDGPVIPKLADSGDAICLLAQQNNQAKVRCWSQHKHKELPVPELDHPSTIAASDGVFCAATEAGLRCWHPSRIDSDHDRPDLVARVLTRLGGPTSHPKILTATYREIFCATAPGEEVRCTKIDMPDGPEATIHWMPEWPVRELVLDQLNHCEILENDTVDCGLFSQFRNPREFESECDTDVYKVPKDLHAPRSLAVTECGACVLDQTGGPVCWGEPERLETWASKTQLPLTGDFFYRQQLQGDVSWLDNGVVYRQGRNGLTRAPWADQIPNVVLVSGVSANNCVVTATDILCGHAKEKEKVVSHGMDVTYFPFGQLRPTLELVKKVSYTAKQPIYQQAISLLEKRTEREQFFVYLALRPLIESTDSQSVQTQVLDLYRRQADYWGRRVHLASLADGVDSIFDQDAALRLLHVLLPPEPEWNGLQAAIGVAMGTLDDLTLLQAPARERAAAIDALTTAERTKGQGLTIQSLLRFLHALP